tara:strand:+ start:138 stop:245 length:108 start_codon:yes stop_codon:yes gene_type:complete
MNKYNNKQEEERANKVLGAMMVVFCILTLLNYVTI